MSTREEHWEQRLAVPVLVAALASIPAMFLSVADGPLGTTGRVIDVLSGVVLLAEVVILLLVAENKRRWLRNHVGLLSLTALVIVAVVFAFGPVQILRLVRSIGALRVLRAGRIVKAAQKLRGRLGFTGPTSHVFAVGAGFLAAVFVGVVLADPTSQSRSLLEAILGDLSTMVVVILSVVAGLVLGVATFLLARDRDDEDEDDGEDDGDDEDAGTPDEAERTS